MNVPYISNVLPTDRKELPYYQFAPDFDMAKHLKEVKLGGQSVLEFIGSDDFTSDWYQRVTYEVDAGRQDIPTVYEPIYDIVVDRSLPETMLVKNWGPGGFVFEELFEGSEVKFGQITAAQAAVSQRQFGVGVEYDKKVVMFNQLWQIARIERAVGQAHNALLNHLHLSPLLTYAYTAPNQTPAATTGTGLTENWFLTLEAAIVESQTDTTNPRMGPYILLVHPSQVFMLERALNRVPQTGFARDSSASQFISTVIGYSGWTGTRGKKTVTYPGVATNKGYLINTAFKNFDFQSFVKQPLESAQGNADVSRFILDQIVWDVWLGIYANPARAVEEITWP
jgi:hypothetical protein